MLHNLGRYLEKGMKYLSRLIEIVGICPVCGSKLKHYEATGADTGIYEYTCGARLEVNGGPFAEDRKWIAECPHKR